MTELLYYFETWLGEDKQTHQVEVLSETEKTYVVKIGDMTRTVRKCLMHSSDVGGTFYFFTSFGECEKAHQEYLKRTIEWYERQAKWMLDEAQNCRNYLWPEKEEEEQ